MKTIFKIESWGDAHHPKAFDIFRMALGLYLVIKGSIFLMKGSDIRDLVINAGISSSSPKIDLIINAIIYIHICGGALILMGVFTRFTALIQIPIVFTALFFVNILSPYFHTELWISIVVLVMLVVFVITGSGPWSIDYLIRTSSDNKLTKML